MKTMKKVILSIFFMLTLFTGLSFAVSAVDMVPIPKWGGGYINYRNTSTQMEMPAEYIEPDSSFRAVWVSNVVNDISTYSSESQYKSEMMRVFDTMEYYNMNAIVFHIRTHHDAMYKSNLNRLSPNYTGVDFDEFDPLEWIIEESHRRGIEFHAWMNPYRIGKGTVESIAAKFPATNPASKVDNLLGGNQNVILDPGRPAVREFLVDTVLEVINNYDVDGIHFDDYFYEAGVDDSATRSLYNTENLSIANFRRAQIDTFIKDLHYEIDAFNKRENKTIQLGISPSGIYRNGSYVPLKDYRYNEDGTLQYPLFSNTSGYSHYDSPLYSDTLKWANEEWIDYIVPQVYWGFDQTAAPHGDIVEWWSGALKNSNVNLYIGTALYTAGDASNDGWTYDTREFANEVQYASKFSNVHGQVIFSFAQLFSSLKSTSAMYYQNMHNVKNEMWYKDAILPEIRTMDPINLEAVKNFELSKTSAGYRLDFDGMTDARTYAIYRSESPLTYDVSELIEVIGKKEIDGKISYIDNISTSKNYYYGVKAISQTNTPGAAVSLSTTSAVAGELIPVGVLPDIQVGENTFFNTRIKLQWESIKPNFGTDLTYAIYTSTDGQNFKKNPDSIKATGNMNSTEVLLGASEKVYFYLNAKNNISNQNSNTYVIDVKNNIGPINYFTYSGNVTAGGVINLKWGQIDNVDEVTYKVQTSSDAITWRDLTGTVKNEGNFGSLSYMLPNHYSNNYYRVVATSPSGSGATSNLRIEAFEKISGLNVLYNGKPITEPIYLNQNETLEVVWNNLTHSSGEVSYRAMVSHDMKDWKIARLYHQSNVVKYYTDTTGHTIFGSFEYLVMYVRIEAYTATALTSSEVFEVRVVPSFTITKVFLDNYFYQYKTTLNKSKIFK